MNKTVICSISLAGIIISSISFFDGDNVFAVNKPGATVIQGQALKQDKADSRNKCTLPNAVSEWDAKTGKCVISKCFHGFADCDRNPANGCEASLKTLQNCGRCGNSCTTGSDWECKAGKCYSETIHQLHVYNCRMTCVKNEKSAKDLCRATNGGQACYDKARNDFNQCYKGCESIQ